MTRRSAGFTLIEVLVAMAIFGVLGALALGGLNAVLDQQALARRGMAELAAVQRTVRLLTGDFAQVWPRIVRDELGRATETSLVADGRGDYLARLTRAGWRNPMGLPRGTLQRVQYRIEDDALIREYWPVVDFPLGMEPRTEILLDDVTTLRLEFLDESGTWTEQWPPLLPGGSVSVQRPRAVRIELELPGWGAIQRLVEVPD